MAIVIDPEVSSLQLVGRFSSKVIRSLRLSIEPCDIFISGEGIEHIRTKHPKIFREHLQDIPIIISEPEYIGYDPTQHSIEYVKFKDLLLIVPVRPSSGNIYYVRSLYELSRENMEAYMRKGQLLPYV